MSSNTFGIFKTISENYMDLVKEEPLYYKETTSMYDRTSTYYMDKEDILQQALIHGGPVLELCCGTGRITLPLLRKNFKVTAVDLSEDMLESLRKSVENNRQYAKYKDNLTVVRGDMNELDFDEKFNTVVIGATSIRLMDDDFSRFFNKIYDILNPGGVFFFDFEDIPVRDDIAEVTEPLQIVDVPQQKEQMVLELLQRHIDYVKKRAYVNMMELKFPHDGKQLISYTQYRVFGVNDITKAATESRFGGCHMTQRPEGIWNCVMQR